MPEKIEIRYDGYTILIVKQVEGQRQMTMTLDRSQAEKALRELEKALGFAKAAP